MYVETRRISPIVHAGTWSWNVVPTEWFCDQVAGSPTHARNLRKGTLCRKHLG